MSSVFKKLVNDARGKGAVSKNNSNEKKRINRQKVLLISSRGITFRHRHLISDLESLLPHSKREPKFDSKKTLYELNEIADDTHCNNIMYFECRKHQDLYLWLSKPPNGPTIKFHVQNLHTLDELNFTGNCLRGSRPILSFDKSFDSEGEHYKLMKEMFIHQFGVPPQARKSKPFVDHVTTFSIVDNKIWIRNYQINETNDLKEEDDHTSKKNEKILKDLTLVEIGPRFVLTPILILEGSFGGPKIYENKEYVSPNFVRAQLKHQAAEQAKKRHEMALERKFKKRDNVVKSDPLANETLFKE